MSQEIKTTSHAELQRWVESLEQVLGSVLKSKSEQAALIMDRLVNRLRESGIKLVDGMIAGGRATKLLRPSAL